MITFRSIDSIREIRASAVAWDDLWYRSGVGLPTKRAAMLAHWVETFAPGGSLTALIVEEAGRMLAALPLVAGKLGHLLPVGKLPINCWSSAGDLLLDPRCDVERVLDCLVAGIRRLTWPLLWFDTIEIEEPRWQAFRAACNQHGLPTEHHTQFHLGLIDVQPDWNAYQARWSKSMRKDIRRRLRKAQEQGSLRLEVHSGLTPETVEGPLITGFEVEDRSWKGPAGTSVLRSPRALAFFCEQARQLAAWGELRLSYLMLDDWPVAFEYGYQSREIHYSHKIGYDEAYRDLGPGHLLLMKMLQRSHGDGHVRLHNCMGMLTQADARWCTRTQPIGRLIVGTGSLPARACILGYRRAWSLKRRMRGSPSYCENAMPRFKPGCAVESHPAAGQRDEQLAIAAR